jgi:hypothetical protein
MNIQNFQLGMTLAPHKDPEIICGNRSLKEYTNFVSVFCAASYTNMAAMQKFCFAISLVLVTNEPAKISM